MDPTDPARTEPYDPPPARPTPSPAPEWDAPADPPTTPTWGAPAQDAATAAGPAWTPPTARRSASRAGDLVFGAILLLVGLWLFADVTLRLALPTIRWGELWPLAVIGLGLWILLTSVRRR